MRSTRIDTDGIFDLCHCGAHPRVIHDTDHQPNSWRVDCMECAETSDWVDSQTQAMVIWNKRIRVEKENR